MKQLGAVHYYFNLKCMNDGLTREQAAKQFKCSWQFILSVLKHKCPMPEWMVSQMAEFTGIDEGIVATSFGYYPKEWVKLCQDTPEVVFDAMKIMLNTIKVNPDMETDHQRGRQLSAPRMPSATL